MVEVYCDDKEEMQDASRIEVKIVVFAPSSVSQEEAY